MEERIVIKVENISKQYRLGVLGGASARKGLSRFWKRTDRNGGSQENENVMWALKDVSFDVGKGDVVGIIGKNGAGKSTLLKILSQITQPTSGRIKIRGKIASLLEVGTGFHAELTGRENIFLNGAILGMPKSEVRKKFDSIIGFSGVDKFIDTPVKRYSSGMYVRLAFAVAAHLEPDILIVDEVLAVGDMEFQKKCLGKMKDVSGQGRTVLFVSHNMNSVLSLCNTGIVLNNGTIAKSGRINEVVDYYLQKENRNLKSGIIGADVNRIRQNANGSFSFTCLVLKKNNGVKADQLYYHESFSIHLSFDAAEEISNAYLYLTIYSATNNSRAVYFTSADEGQFYMTIPKGKHQVSMQVDPRLLPGAYYFEVQLNSFDDKTIYDKIEFVYEFNVIHPSESGNNHFRWAKGNVYGMVNPKVGWGFSDGITVKELDYVKGDQYNLM